MNLDALNTDLAGGVAKLHENARNVGRPAELTISAKYHVLNLFKCFSS